MSFTINISSNAEQILREVKTVPDEMVHGIARAMDLQNQFTIGHIARDYLSYPKDEPPVPTGLRVQSGRLRASINANKAIASGGRIDSSIGSNVSYAAVHEFGFNGDVEVPAHQRTSRKGNTFAVRAFTRRMNLPARAPIQHGIQDRANNYAAAVSAAILDAWNKKS